jgi:CheY-like chemotaxis protein
VESPLTILFVEDETELRSLVRGMLLAQGFRVFVAPDGIDALHILHAHHVDLLFTDIVMPGIDGVQLAKRARGIRPGLKVLFTTGYVQRATEREAARFGPVLFKPLRYTEIIQEVEALLGAAA